MAEPHFLESIPGPCRRPAFVEKQMAIVDQPPSPRPSPASGRGSNARPPLPLAGEEAMPGPLSRLRERKQCRAPSPACGRGSNARPPLPLAGEEAMPGPLSRLRERVGVRVFACRQGFVSHEHPRPLLAPGVRRETDGDCCPTTLTCSARIGLQADAVRWARRVRLERPTSPPALSRKRAREQYPAPSPAKGHEGATRGPWRGLG